MTRKYYEPEPAYEVVWHGAIESEWGKGILLEPREQNEEERLRALPVDPLGGLSKQELREAVERLNQSLAKPIDWQETSVFRGRV